jgi:hypothetical protein
MIKLLFILLPFYCISQTYIVDEQFGSTMPTGWSSPGSATPTLPGWVAYMYGVGNARSGAYSLRLSSASNTNSRYLYVPITVKAGHSYLISFYTKRACSLTININETANQTTLLESTTHSNSNCNSNFSNWYNWSDVYVPTSDGVLYIQILIKTVYGQPTSVYLDDFRVLEQAPISLPIELLNFTAWATDDGKLVTDWEVATEQDVWKYYIMRSIDGTRYHRVDSVVDIGSSAHPKKYRVITNNDIPNIIIYVMLRELDTDGTETDFNPIAVLMPSSPRRVVGIYNCLGQSVAITEPGVIIIVYDDGTKQYKINEFGLKR